MSFTIKCNKCGTEREFTGTSSKHSDGISVGVFTTGSYQGDVIESISIDCENPKCFNAIEIKY